MIGVIMAINLPLDQLREANLSLGQLREANLPLEQLIEVNRPLEQLREEGETLKRAKEWESKKPKKKAEILALEAKEHLDRQRYEEANACASLAVFYQLEVITEKLEKLKRID